jgi:predicted metal-binding protein
MFPKIDELANHALNLSVSTAKAMAAEKVSVQARFPGLCARQPCPGFDKSLNCPPHVMRPERFQKILASHDIALAFKYDVPTAVLRSDARMEIVRKLHLVAAQLEQKALDLGAAKAQGLAGGSCWQAFCAVQGDCPALGFPEKCRYPEKARPSLSGLGVDVFQLCADLDWPIQKITQETDPDEVPMGLMAGLVLIG